MKLYANRLELHQLAPHDLRRDFTGCTPLPYSERLAMFLLAQDKSDPVEATIQRSEDRLRLMTGFGRGIGARVRPPCNPASFTSARCTHP